MEPLIFAFAVMLFIYIYVEIVERPKVKIHETMEEEFNTNFTDKEFVRFEDDNIIEIFNYKIID